MGLYADMSPGLTDLKLSIIRNRTSKDFLITLESKLHLV